MKQAIHQIMESGEPGNLAGQIFDSFITLLILLNVLALVLGTVERISQLSPEAFRIFEAVSVAVFTVEFLMRVWSCTADGRYSHAIWGRLRFAASPIVAIDLLALLPFYVVLLGILPAADFRFLRAIRLLARVARMGRYSTGLHTLARVVYVKGNELFTVILVLSVLLLMASSAMFYAESEAQPQKFGSIPEAMWWTIITLTTVGYGDVFPITVIGRIIAGVIAILGIGMFALPAGILGSGFVDEMRNRNSPPPFCPNCGQQISQ